MSGRHGGQPGRLLLDRRTAPDQQRARPRATGGPRSPGGDGDVEQGRLDDHVVIIARGHEPGHGRCGLGRHRRAEDEVRISDLDDSPVEPAVDVEQPGGIQPIPRRSGEHDIGHRPDQFGPQPTQPAMSLPGPPPSCQTRQVPVGQDRHDGDTRRNDDRQEGDEHLGLAVEASREAIAVRVDTDLDEIARYLDEPQDLADLEEAEAGPNRRSRRAGIGSAGIGGGRRAGRRPGSGGRRGDKRRRTNLRRRSCR